VRDFRFPGFHRPARAFILPQMGGEFDFIQWIRSQQKPRDFVKIGVGDDLAVLKWPTDDLLLIGADQVLDGVHFDSKIHPPRTIGKKAMNRNLSDCAAMACLPAAAVVTVALPKGIGEDFAKELYLGMKEAADVFDCAIVGGDTGAWEGKLAVSVTIVGKADGMAPVTRYGAKAGDTIFVTGPLGGSILGRHLTFEPKVELARNLALRGNITSMIDLSDGLSRDLGHICRQSAVGAIIFGSKVPIHADALTAFRQDHRSPLEHALHDGEDYELLFSAAAGFNSIDVIPIGVMTSESGIWLDQNGSRVPLEPRGWEHHF
jgi:thiamine-monophosphate kinase